MSKRWLKFVMLPLAILATLMAVSYTIFLRTSGIGAALATEEAVSEEIDRLCFPKTAEEADRIYNIPNDVNAGDELQQLILKESALVPIPNDNPTAISTYRGDLEIKNALDDPVSFDHVKFNKEYKFGSSLWQGIAPLMSLKRCRIPFDVRVKNTTDNRHMQAVNGQHLLTKFALVQAFSDIHHDLPDQATITLARAHWLVKRLPDSVFFSLYEDSSYMMRYYELRICKAALTGYKSGSKTISYKLSAPLLKEMANVVSDAPMRTDFARSFKAMFFVLSNYCENLGSTKDPSSFLPTGSSTRWASSLPRVREAWKLRLQSAFLVAFEAGNEKSVPEIERTQRANQALRLMIEGKKDLSYAPWRGSSMGGMPSSKEIQEIPKLEAEVKALLSKRSQV